MHIPTPNNLDWERLAAWKRSTDIRRCPRCAGTGRIASSVCPVCSGETTLRRDVRPLIASSKLVKFAGGLLRIKDDYEPVWRLHADDDGRSYIVRAEDDDLADTRIYVADDASEREPVVARVLSVAEAENIYGAWAVEKMQSLGVSRAREDLLEHWAATRTAELPGGGVPGISGGVPMGNSPTGGGHGADGILTAGPQQATPHRGWPCPHCGESLPGGSEFREHQRNEHGIADGD